jgi:putative phosphoribosyl transferase
VVAAEVAQLLGVPLDVLIVRKLGHPQYREYAVGALAENGVFVFDAAGRGDMNLQAGLQEVIAEEQERMRAYQAKFHFDRTPALVDDGLATGATMEAAVVSARKSNAQKVTVAVPVASTNAFDRLSQVADEVRVLWVDPEFDAVGRYYKVFSQTTDEEVMDLLKAEAHRS